jgi:hypothetical protein
MAAFQDAASKSNSVNTIPAKKNFGKVSMNKTSSFVPTVTTGSNFTKTKSKQSVGKLNINTASFVPTVDSSTSCTKKEKAPAVKKLDKSKTHLIASVLGPGNGGAYMASGGADKHGLVQSQTPQIRRPFQKSDLTAGSATTQAEQEQAHMSERAKTALVAPKEVDVNEPDWDFLNQLAVQYDHLKQQGVEETKNPNSMPKSEARQKLPTKRQEAGDKTNIKSSLEGLIGGTSFKLDGSFITQDYLDQFLVENEKFNSVTFDFSGQTKLFKRFDRKDKEQRSISHKFVEELLKHPKASKITSLNFANSLLPDSFLIALSEQCLASGALPNLQVLNLESNLIGQDGVSAMSPCIANPEIWKRLQVLKLENQKTALPSDAEEVLGQAVLQSRSLVVVSLRVRSGLARQQINNTVKHNIDMLRKARRQVAAKEGNLKERKRNEMEAYFDKIAENQDASITTTVDLTGNLKFLGLHATERLKAATAFATNKNVKTIKLVKLKLDDAFAKEFSKALATNTTVEKVCLDSNEISSNGITALMEGLGHNTSITDFQVRHQCKTLSSADEEKLPDLLEGNMTLVKLGVDVRNQFIRTKLERKMNANREWQRKQRRANKE